MNTKSSQSFPPDKKSMLLAIKWIHNEVYYWSRVDEAIISDIPFQDNVWIANNKNEEVRPLWLTGMLLVSCLYFHSNQQI